MHGLLAYRCTCQNVSSRAGAAPQALGAVAGAGEGARTTINSSVCGCAAPPRRSQSPSIASAVAAAPSCSTLPGSRSHPATMYFPFPAVGTTADGGAATGVKFALTLSRTPAVAARCVKKLVPEACRANRVTLAPGCATRLDRPKLGSFCHNCYGTCSLSVSSPPYQVLTCLFS